MRGLEADHLQDIEGNPLTPEERRMFAMFESEGWTAERQRTYVLAQVLGAAAVRAAE